MSEAPPFDTLKEQFAATPMALDPAELHGVLCALLSFDADTDAEVWLKTALGDDLAMYELDGEVRQSLYWLFDWCRENLNDEAFGFALLLPDDSSALSGRLSALSAWSAGFSAGVGHMTSDLDQLPPEVSEFVTDLAEIIRADSEFEDHDDEAEDHYYEVAEYVRLGAMMTFEALCQGTDPGVGSAAVQGFETGQDFDSPDGDDGPPPGAALH